MKNIIADINDKIGFACLPDTTRQFILTHFNFLLFTTIPGVFLNTFFYNQDGKISTVAMFTAISSFTLAVVMHFASVVSIKTSSSTVIRIGVALYNVFFIFLLLFRENAADNVILLSLLNGIANGFYWQGYNELARNLTTEGNLDKTLSLLGLVTSVVNLLIPMVSGGVIMSFPTKGIGYTVIFVISFLFSVYTTYISFKLEKQKSSIKSNIPGMLKFMFTDKTAMLTCAAEFARGIRNSSFPLFLSIIFYRQVMNEGILGINTTLSGLVAIVSFLAASKILRPENRVKYIYIASFLSIVLFLPLFISTSPAILFILTLVNALVGAFIDNPSIGIFFTIFRGLNNGVSFAQLMSGRELFLALGRATGLFILAIFSQSDFLLAVFALIANAALLINIALYSCAYKMYKKKQSICEVKQ